MNLADFWTVAKSHGSISLGVLFILLTLVQITPIKVNPWSAILRWIGKQANGELFKRMDVLEEKFNKHLKESEDRDVRERRAMILAFARSCMRKEPHTQEDFEFYMHECDLYEQYCEEKHIPNGVADTAIGEIRRVYGECLRNNTFLTNGIINN